MQFKNQQRALKRLKVIVPITILLIFSLPFWAFHSVHKTSMALMIVLFALIGGIARLALVGLHFSVSAAVGFIALAGISVQNNVIWSSRAKVSIRERGSKGRRSLVVHSDDGADGRPGIAAGGAVPKHRLGTPTPVRGREVGGIVSASFFTLLLLPLIYPYFASRDEPDV